MWNAIGLAAGIVFIFVGGPAHIANLYIGVFVIVLSIFVFILFEWLAADGDQELAVLQHEYFEQAYKQLLQKIENVAPGGPQPGTVAQPIGLRLRDNYIEIVYFSHSTPGTSGFPSASTPETGS